MLTSTTALLTKTTILRTVGAFALLLSLMFVPLAQKASAQTVSELQAMINQLMAQIAAQSGGGGEVMTGKQVITTTSLRVRATPATNGKIVRVVAVGTVGTVLAGPTSAGGVRWYQVQFNNGVSGWVAGEWLAEVTGKKVVDVNSFVKTSSAGQPEIEVGAEDVAIANISLSPVRFDRYVNKVVLEFSPAEDNEVSQPWVAFEDVSLWSRGWKVLEVDASNPNAWRKVGSTYQITVYTGNNKIAANRAYELIAAVSTEEDDAPAGDRWNVRAPKGGVVIWSEVNGHMTNAAALTAYPLIFVGEETSADAEVVIEELDTLAAVNKDGEAQFEIEFEVTANDEDVYIKNFTHRTGTKNPGVAYNVDGPSEGTVTASLSSSADQIDGGVFQVEEGETEEFTLEVTVVASVTGEYRVALNGISYSEDPSGTVDMDFTEPEDDIETKYVAIIASGDPVMSQDGASITVTSGGSLRTEHGVWTFGKSGASGGSVILLNGVQAAKGSAIELHVKQRGVFARNKSNVWYEWRANARWVKLASNPLEASSTPTPSAMKINNFTASPAVVPVLKNGQQKVQLTWSSSGTAYCNVWEDPRTNNPILLAEKVNANGTFSVTPVWKDGEQSFAKQYRVVCQDAATEKDSVVGVMVEVKLASAPQVPAPASTTIPAASSSIVLPTVTAELTPRPVEEGGSVTLTWSSTNAQSCSLITVPAGTQVVAPIELSGTKTISLAEGGVVYRVRCIGMDAKKTPVVKVLKAVVKKAAPIVAPVSASSTPSGIVQGVSTSKAYEEIVTTIESIKSLLSQMR